MKPKLSRGARALRRWAKRYGHTQADMARLLGIDRRRLHGYWHGHRAVTDVRLAIRIYTATGIPVADWLTK